MVYLAYFVIKNATIRPATKPSAEPTTTSSGLCPSATRGNGTFADGTFFITSTNASPCSPIDRRATKASYMIISANTVATENSGVIPSLKKMTATSATTTAEWLLGILPERNHSFQVLCCLVANTYLQACATK